MLQNNQRFGKRGYIREMFVHRTTCAIITLKTRKLMLEAKNVRFRKLKKTNLKGNAKKLVDATKWRCISTSMGTAKGQASFCLPTAGEW